MEKLTVKNLGPIKDFTMETNRLTVLIGPQASGKSLLMQLLYFTSDLVSLAAENHVDSIDAKQWIDYVLFGLLSGVRGAVISQYTSPPGASVKLEFENSASLSFDIKEKVYPDSNLERSLLVLREEWINNKSSLGRSIESKNVYIPSERMLFSIMRDRKESVLYDMSQTLQMRRFCSLLENMKLMYMGRLNRFDETGLDDFFLVYDKQVESLGGAVKYDSVGWRWDFAGGHNLVLSGISSGQMATWPFYALSSVLASSTVPYRFYYEEPELHLHPAGQTHVVEVISHLLKKNHRVVITTHSPFILYVINNLIQAHIAYDGTPPEGEFSINPDHVAAYCLGDNPRSIVDKETRLLDLDEIDDVFDDIGEYFQSMLDKAYAKRKKNK